MGLGNYILDADGNPLEVDDAIAWAKWYQEADRHVQSDRIPVSEGEVILVSTVFLGVDHSFGLGGPPILWETMIFGGKGSVPVSG